MISIFNIPELTLLLYKISLMEHKFREFKEMGQGSRQLTDSERDILKKQLNDTVGYCKSVGFRSGAEKAASLLAFFLAFSDRYDVSAIGIEVTNLNSAIMKDIYDRKFVAVVDGVSGYLDMEHPFGQAVSDAFPSAKADLVEAGNCLALGCNAAMVYHLMRAAEVGLWELGRDRQIPLAQSGKIEFSQWGDVLKELEGATKAIQNWPNSRTKEDAHRFYNAALVEIRAFNDGWRRHSAHPRPHMPPMETDEAIALWGHVCRFMATLASKISEGHYTPLQWS